VPAAGARLDQAGEDEAVADPLGGPPVRVEPVQEVPEAVDRLPRQPGEAVGIVLKVERRAETGGVADRVPVVRGRIEPPVIVPGLVGGDHLPLDLLADPLPEAGIQRVPEQEVEFGQLEADPRPRVDRPLFGRRADAGEVTPGFGVAPPPEGRRVGPGRLLTERPGVVQDVVV